MASRIRHSNSSARQRPIVLLCLGHTVLNVISLIISRGKNQGIEFPAGNWHLVLTPLRSKIPTFGGGPLFSQNQFREAIFLR